MVVHARGLGIPRGVRARSWQRIARGTCSWLQFYTLQVSKQAVYYEELFRFRDLNEAAGAADATRDLDGSVYALRLK